MAWFSGPGSSPRHTSHHSPSRHSTRSQTRYSTRHSHSSTSQYRRRPRDGYINAVVHQIKKLVRDIYGYARRHPVKIFMLVIMPLITGGALHSVLRKFGISLPAGVARAMGGAGGQRGKGSSYEYRREELSSDLGGGLSGALGGGGTLQSMMKIAQMFI